MRVKRLEIQGFKSFKDKTIIHFDHSITGIVGPNGCGKSNIVDAFFWVMGEQSYKHMRGSSGDDLIFNGSSKYSPLGMAEATLVLESDVIDQENAPSGATAQDIPLSIRTKEISVTRRLYRSGEGEYFINGTTARLKDIHELFMDTGVGAKGYSVIEQGQIGKVVNSKPEERRLLIEEAAGIAKYKARKKESLRKMEATQANLSRLTDILQEIEKTLTSLERQAQKAQLYKKYKSELFSKEMTWGKRKKAIFTKKLETFKQDRVLLEEDLVGLRAQLQISENEIEVDRVTLLTETQEAERLQLKIQEFSEDLSQEKSALELSHRRQGDLESQLENLQTEQAELQISVSENKEKLLETERQEKEVHAAHQAAAAEAHEKSNLLTTARKAVEAARGQVDQAQKEWMSGVSQIADLNSKTKSLFSQAEAGRAQASRLSVQMEGLLEKIETLRDELQKFESELDAAQAQKNELRTQLDQNTQSLQIEEKTLLQLENEKNQTQRKLTQLKSKLQSLEELDEAHEGLTDAPRAGLEWAKKSQKNHLVYALTDALDVTAGYETVLQGWLENKIENLVAEDSETAFALLEQIKQSKQGRVGIQLRNALVNASNKSAKSSFKEVQILLESHGFKVIGELSQFITPHHSEKKGLDLFLQNVCIVETTSPILTFSQSMDFEKFSGWSLIDLEGVAYEAEGILRGGHLGPSGAVGILRRKRLIEELRVQDTQVEQEHQKAEQALTDAKQNIEARRNQVKDLQNEIQIQAVQIAGLDRDVHQTRRSLQEAQIQQENLDQDSHEIRSEIENALNEREIILNELNTLSSSHSQTQDQITQAETLLAEKEQQFRAQDQELQTIRLQEASLRERSGSLRREMDAAQSLILDREKRLTEIRKTLERTSREKIHFSESESDLTEKIEDLVLLLADSREKLAAVKDRMEQTHAKVNHHMAATKDLHKSIEHKTSSANQFALEIEKLSSDLAHLIANLEEKYGPGCLEEHIPCEARTPEDVLGDSRFESRSPEHLLESSEITAAEEQELNEEVEKIRERIRRLGEVNVMAIEEHEVLKKRYDHLLTEKQDLERSLENLSEAIQHINKTSEERFKKAFEAIANRFERLFPIIFGGGQANLTLVYPEGSSDILEAGVDIHAQPPGKKVANITLLSGGEKALTAVSLIFSIFMIKPSPFCVLDEVDAPLDDANIGKFNALLREMSSKSQFILITHNKKTMELNDTLYGVTMEEPGVSRMVSIELH